MKLQAGKSKAWSGSLVCVKCSAGFCYCVRFMFVFSNFENESCLSLQICLTLALLTFDPHSPFGFTQADFSTALGLMQLEATVVDESWTKTPTCKKPRMSEQVADALATTPPPIMGPQTETCFPYWCKFSSIVFMKTYLKS